jgi:hypothetical protein
MPLRGNWFLYHTCERFHRKLIPNLFSRAFKTLFVVTLWFNVERNLKSHSHDSRPKGSPLYRPPTHYRHIFLMQLWNEMMARVVLMIFSDHIDHPRCFCCDIVSVICILFFILSVILLCCESCELRFFYLAFFYISFQTKIKL